MLKIWRLIFAIALVAIAGELVVAGFSSTPSFDDCRSATHAQSSSAEVQKTSKGTAAVFFKCLGASVDQNNGVVTAVATVFLTIITGWLVWVAREQSKTTQVQLRAFIHATALHSRYELDKITEHHNWRLQPTWTNSGDTPTRHLRIYTACEVRNDRLPEGFDFRQMTGTSGTGLLGPKVQLQGGQAPQLPAGPLTPEILNDVRNGKKHIYLWGWARYNDTFPGTAEHITRFCWYIFVNGDPFEFSPQAKPGELGSLSFSYAHHAQGNCADDECLY